jgi:FtsP/CotA-like multicopper oxidase with cupredoxin domain
VLGLLPGLLADASGRSMPMVAANDNRVPAGQLVGHELHLALVAVWGRWYPDGPTGQAAPIQVFEQAGQAPQNPGPVIRVPQGTLVVLSVRNAIPGTRLTMHGLMDRPALRDRSFVVPYGQTHLVRFRAGAPGTFLYWGSTTRGSFTARFGLDSQLNGAFVIDPPHATAQTRNDRIFVIEQWVNVSNKDGSPDFDYELDTINGLAWPHTERLSYDVGQTVRWRLIDASEAAHPMHLHLVLAFSQVVFLLLLAENELMYRLVSGNVMLRIGFLLVAALGDALFIISTLFHQTYGYAILHTMAVVLLPFIPFVYFVARLRHLYSRPR